MHATKAPHDPLHRADGKHRRLEHEMSEPRSLGADTSCTCGSGGHPRHCSTHPLAYRAHCCLVNAYAQIPDCPEWEMLAYEATLAEWEDAERADWLQRVEAAAPKWQPIETAPRDRTSILAADGWGRRMIVHWLPLGPGPLDPARTGTWMDGGDDDVSPTHWMPLPGAPRE